MINFQKTYEEAEKYYQQGNFKKAISLLEKKLQENLKKIPKIEFLYLLGKFKSTFLKNDSALDSILEGLTLAKEINHKELESKGTLYFHKISGELAINDGKNGEGLSLYSKARTEAEKLGLWEEELHLLLLEGKAYFYLGDDERAKQLLALAREKAKKHQHFQFLSTILGDLGDLFLREGNSENAKKNYTEALTLAEKENDILGKVEAYSRLGKWHLYSGDPEQALDFLTKAVHLAKESENIQGQIDALGSLGKIYFFLGENEGAKSSYKEALELAKKNKDSLGELNNLGNLGNVSLRLGQMEEGLHYFGESLKMARLIQDVQGEMNTLGWLGDIFYQKGENIKALNHYYKALELSKRMGYLLGESTNLGRIGDIYFSRYENETAFQKYSQALQLARKANSPSSVLNNLISLGDIYHRKGEDDQALKHYEEALVIADQLNSTQGMLNAIQSLGEVYFRRGREDEALQRFRQSLGLSRKLEDPTAEIISLRGIGDVFFRKGDYKKANTHYKKALQMSIEMEDSLEELIQKSRIGEIYLKRGKRELALKYFSEAYQLAKKYDSPEGLLTTLMALGSFDIGQGKIDKAEDKFREAAILAERLDEPLERIKALSMVGWISLQQGNFSDALKVYQKSTELLTPIALGDIEEDRKDSKEDQLNRLKNRVLQASKAESTLEVFLPTTPDLPNLKEATAAFHAVPSLEEDYPKESQSKTSSDSKNLNRKCWKILEDGINSSKMEEVFHSVVAFRKMKVRKILPMLEKAYETYRTEKEILEQIIRAFEDFPGKDSGPALSRLFRQEKRMEFKILLAEALSKQEHLGGVDCLLSLATSSNEYQQKTIEALGNSGQKEVIPSLQELLKTVGSNARLATTILTALLSLGDSSAEIKLVDSLNSSDLINMFFTAKALARAGKSSAVTSLELITETIIENGNPSKEEFSILQKSMEERILVDGGNAEFLQKVYQFKPIRPDLFLMLTKKSASFLQEELKQSLNSQEDWKIRTNACHALGYLEEEILNSLQEVLYFDTSKTVQVAASGSILRILSR